LQYAREKGEFGILKSCSVERELGRGGFGAVYLVRDADTDTKLALKLLFPQVTVEPEAKAAFLREMANASALDHPNLLRLHSYGVWNALCFSVWEFCEGGSIDQLLQHRGQPLEARDAVPIILDVLQGLEYAHKARLKTRLSDGRVVETAGLVHRDIKPANIFLSRIGDRQIAKIGDYGLSKAFDTAGLSGLTRTGSGIGSYQYLARQQVVSYKYSKPDVDVWAMAASLYAMLTNFCPRDFREGKDVWLTILETNAVPIRERRASIPRKLAEVIDKALVDRPEIGFKSAGELRRALLEAFEAN
jgi:serine/threonine protein kinase